MKKYINTAFYYAIAAMAGGVFYREFTKFNGFSGKTTLAVVHTHLFLLGMVVLLAAALFCQRMDGLSENKKMKRFYGFYSIGVPLTVVMLVVRGVPQVLGLTLSKGLDASISGIAGMGHILTGIGIIFFFLALKEETARLPQYAGK